MPGGPGRGACKEQQGAGDVSLPAQAEERRYPQKCCPGVAAEGMTARRQAVALTGGVLGPWRDGPRRERPGNKQGEEASSLQRQQQAAVAAGSKGAGRGPDRKLPPLELRTSVAYPARIKAGWDAGVQLQRPAGHSPLGASFRQGRPGRESAWLGRGLLNASDDQKLGSEDLTEVRAWTAGAAAGMREKIGGIRQHPSGRRAAMWMHCMSCCYWKSRHAYAQPDGFSLQETEQVEASIAKAGVGFRCLLPLCMRICQLQLPARVKVHRVHRQQIITRLFHGTQLVPLIAALLTAAAPAPPARRPACVNPACYIKPLGGRDRNTLEASTINRRAADMACALPTSWRVGAPKPSGNRASNRCRAPRELIVMHAATASSSFKLQDTAPAVQRLAAASPAFAAALATTQQAMELAVLRLLLEPVHSGAAPQGTFTCTSHDGGAGAGMAAYRGAPVHWYVRRRSCFLPVGTLCCRARFPCLHTSS